MVASQALFAGASATDVMMNEIASCCCTLGYNMLMGRNFFKSSPWLDYSIILRDDGSIGKKCGTFGYSRMTPMLFRNVGCNATEHKPACPDMSERTGGIEMVFSSCDFYEVETLCGCNEPCNTYSFALKMGATMESLMEGFIKVVEQKFVSAITAPVTVKDSGTNGVHGTRTYIEDGVVTVDASTTGLTLAKIEEIKGYLANNGFALNDILFVVPYPAISKLILEAYGNGATPLNFLYEGATALSLFGNNFYTTYNPKEFFAVQSNVEVVGGTTVNDVILGYAIPKRAFMFNYVPHILPRPNGVENSIGVNPVLPAMYNAMNDLYDTVYTSRSTIQNVTNFMKVIVDSTRNYLPMGAILRAESKFGIMRSDYGSIVRIALPKSYVA